MLRPVRLVSLFDEEFACRVGERDDLAERDVGDAFERLADDLVQPVVIPLDRVSARRRRGREQAAPVVRVLRSCDESGAFEPVQQRGDAAGCQVQQMADLARGVRPVVIKEPECGDLGGADAELIGNRLAVAIPAEDEPLQREGSASNGRTIVTHSSRALPRPLQLILIITLVVGGTRCQAQRQLVTAEIGRITLQHGEIGLAHFGRTTLLPSPRDGPNGQIA